MPPSAPPAVIPGTFNPRPGGAAFNAPVDEAAEHAKHSIKENRVYVGNLSYDVRYKDLEQFMTDGAWAALGSQSISSCRAMGWRSSQAMILLSRPFHTGQSAALAG